jgi:rhomboid family GlyGly-CTERM serine protease
MKAQEAYPRWTLLLTGAIVVLNLGLFPGFEGQGGELLTALQYNGTAIREGQVWRLLTGNLVHWSLEHFFLDWLAFLALGLLYGRRFGRSYPWLLLWIAAVVGLAEWLFWPEQTLCRGLSGVTAGQFAAALWLECTVALRTPSRWLWVAPAAAIFLFWLAYGAVTGHGFFVTDVAALAHMSGAAAAVSFCLVLSLTSQMASSTPRPSPESGTDWCPP